MSSTKTDRVLICLPSEEASALVELGAALEPFIQRDSPADRATGKMDEQVAQQRRGYDDLVRCAEDILENMLWQHFTEGHPAWGLLHDAAAECVDQVLGYYGDDD